MQLYENKTPIFKHDKIKTLKTFDFDNIKYECIKQNIFMLR